MIRTESHDMWRGVLFVDWRTCVLTRMYLSTDEGPTSKGQKKLGLSSGPKLIGFLNTFKSNKKKSTLDGTVMFSPLALEPHTFLDQFKATWASGDEYTWSHTDKHTHTHQLPQMVSRLVEHQDSPPVRNDFGTTIKLHKQNSPEEVTFWTLQYIPLSNTVFCLYHPNMLVLGQNGIITFILPAFAAAHCFGPAVLPRFCCYHVWPVGQPLEDLCSYVACDSPSLRCQVNVKSNELLSTMLMYIFFEETFLLLEIKKVSLGEIQWK